MIVKELQGKKVRSVGVDRFGVAIIFTDGSVFEYNASDGGCSTWEITEAEYDYDCIKIDTRERCDDYNDMDWDEDDENNS